MPRFSRRRFLKASAFAGIGTAIGSATILSAPSVLTRPRTTMRTVTGELLFRPHYVQQGRGPHLLGWAYASDPEWDAFHSNITLASDGVRISDTEGKPKFGINVRWNIEGFGYLFVTADNEGELYELPPTGKQAELNLNFELAKSRVARNRRRLKKHTTSGWVPSREVSAFVDLSEGLLEDARKVTGNEAQRGLLSQKSLLHAMRASEALELDHARFAIALRGHRPGFHLGCDARALYQMNGDFFLDRFAELFDFAAITHVWQGKNEIEDFEPEEGKHNYGKRDLIFERLRARNITVEGRLLFWFHKWVTPDWIRNKSYDQLLGYVERTTREVVGHYGDGMYAWEIVNELHDWANECRLTPEQTVELTRLACDVAKAVAPHVHRMVNNCCPYAEYVQMKQWSGQDALYRQRTPIQFTRDLVDAGVDFTIIGQQLYFPYRDFQDIVMLIERYEQFGKPVQISEIGCSSGPTNDSVKLGTVGIPREPYVWHRPWDEELQADWMEGLYTLAYSKPYVEGAHWFDFVDPFSYIENGGLLRSAEGEKKAVFDRLLSMQRRWKSQVNRSGRRN
jgi:endo-1,4-beta-xylanase